MSKPNVYYWAPSLGDGFDNGIALLQSVQEDYSVVLLSNTPGTPGVFSYINTLSSNPTTSKDLIRSINITSDDDNSEVTFTINGIGTSIDNNDNPTGIIGPISEDIAGPNGETVTSENIYTIVNSIIVTGAAATNVKVGYGPNGITNYTSIDYNRTFSSISSSFQFMDQADISQLSAICFGSLNKPETPNPNGNITPFGTEADTFIPAFDLGGGAKIADTLINITSPVSVLWASISTNSVLSAASAYFTVLQQGTHS